MREPTRREAAAWLAACICAPAAVTTTVRRAATDRRATAPRRAAVPRRAARASFATGVVQPSLTGSARTVTPWLLGLNGVNTTGPRWDDASFDAVLGKFAPGVIRYPGGTAANYWSWADGWFQPGGGWPGEPAKAVDDSLPVFAVAVAAAGAVPLFDLNTVTYNGAIGSAADNTAMLDQQLQFLQAASAQGMPVQMAELGNELYLNGFRNTPPGPHNQDYATRFPTAADYANQMNPWIAAIHSAFPGARVAAVAADAQDVRGGVSQRRQTWNAGVLPLLYGQDAVTLHENLRVFDATADPATVLSTPYLHFQHLAANELALFGSYRLPVWITEFNLADQTPGRVFDGTWLHGLFVAEEALLFVADPAIEYAGLNWTAGTAAAAIFAGSRGFGGSGPATVPLASTAAGATLAIIQAAFHRASTAQPLGFSPNPALNASGAPSLLGSALTTGSGTELLILNLSAQPLTVDLSAMLPGGYQATQVTAPSTTTKVTGPGSVQVGSSAGAGALVVGAYALADVSG